jgi:hypothetical protein
MFVTLFCSATLADNQGANGQDANSQEKAIQVKVIESGDYLKEVLPKIAQVAKELKEKEFYRLVSPVPTDAETDRCSKAIDDHLRFIRGVFSPTDQSIKINWQRKDRAELHLALLKVAKDAIDPDIASEFNDRKRRRGQMSISPEPDESDDTGQVFLGAVHPDTIKHPKTRDNYRMALWENSKIILDYQIHRVWIDILDKEPDRAERVLLGAYRQAPRADQELIDLLEQYEYPEAEKIKLLEKLNMSKEDFQAWRSSIDPPGPVARHKLQPGEILDGNTVSKTEVRTITVPKVGVIDTSEFPVPPPVSHWHIFATINGIGLLLILIVWALWRSRKEN